MLKYLFYIYIGVSIVFLLGGKSYTHEQISAANFLAKNKIIHDWSRIPSRYKFNNHLRLVDALNMSLILQNISKNVDCRGDFSELLSPYSNEWCYTFETAKDYAIFDPQGQDVSPLQYITYGEFVTLFMGVKNFIPPTSLNKSRNLKRGEAFLFLNDIYTPNSIK